LIQLPKHSSWLQVRRSWRFVGEFWDSLEWRTCTCGPKLQAMKLRCRWSRN
jgi:hypothetical protein